MGVDALNILVISSDADAHGHLDFLLAVAGPASRVTLFDPAADGLIDVRPFDIIAFDARSPLDADALDDKLWPVNEVKPVLSLDFERLVAQPARAMPCAAIRTAEAAAPLHS